MAHLKTNSSLNNSTVQAHVVYQNNIQSFIGLVVKVCLFVDFKRYM